MKRSKSVRLTLMGAAAATQLAACDQAPPTSGQPPAYTTVQECVTAGNEQQACQTAFDQAQAAHAQNAPKFNTREECESGVDVDRCTPTQVRQPDGSITNMFVPAIAGYLLGNALANRGGYGGGYGYGPIYRSRQYGGGYRDGGDLLSTRQQTNLPATQRAPVRPPNVNTTTISRQGFGSTGFGGGGG